MLYVRIYDTEEAATETAAELVEAGIDICTVFRAGEAVGKAAETVHSAIEAGTLSPRQEHICTRNLVEGRSLVSANPIFGRGADALEIMEKRASAHNEKLRRYRHSESAPLSDALGIPTLSKFESATELVNSRWALSGNFGIPLLSKSAAPLSSLFRIKVLTRAKRDWRSSFGLPLLSNKAAPLSSLFGMKTIITPRKDWKLSFGFPLLSKNPAPLSRLLGLRTLSKDK